MQITYNSITRYNTRHINMAAAAKTLDVVVFGAGGFTGRLVCEHIARDYHGKVRWAMAGRDAAKLETVKRELAKVNPAVEAVPVIVADAFDKPALSSMAASASVVINVAGPYAKYGDNVVAAALEQGAHYCDITGELNWVKRMVDAHHNAAAAKGVKIVHCCGYDSVPFDIGALVVVDHIRSKLGAGTSQVYGLVEDARGGVSGGTIASAVNFLTNEAREDVRAATGDKYYLAPPGARRGTDKPAGLLPEYNKLTQTWMAPFVMEVVNSRVIHRSAALASPPYGRDFKYREAVSARSLAVAALTSGLTALGGLVLSVGPLRALALRYLPKPGEGPSRETRETGYWRHAAVGVSDESPPRVVKAKCADPHRDGGYWSTSRMLLEAGLCLALDGERLQAAGLPKGGVLTPASAMGLVLADRLRAAGITFDIVESPALGGGADGGSGTVVAAGATSSSAAV